MLASLKTLIPCLKPPLDPQPDSRYAEDLEADLEQLRLHLRVFLSWIAGIATL